jgi:riboflavin-specific deaminase-like protein
LAPGVVAPWRRGLAPSWHRVGTVDPMRQLLPVPADVDPFDAYQAADRPAPAGRPWVVLTMVSSLDGATSVGGRSGRLGGEVDRTVFRAVRAVADVILVAAGTARAEGYGPVRLSQHAVRARAAAGRAPEPPRLAVVSRSLDLDPHAPMFVGATARPLLLTTTDADEGRVAALAEVAEVRRIGDGAVDVSAALRSIGDDGAGVVVCEGGPRLNAAMVAADLVDELCLTLAPDLVGGDSARLVSGAAEALRPFELVSLVEGDGVLCGRWVRRR